MNLRNPGFQESDVKMTNDVSLVTGGAGFIGRHIVAQLVESGETVRVFDVNPGVQPFPDGVEVVQGSVLDQKQVEDAMAGVRFVYHLAADPNLWARDKSTFYNTNFEGTFRVLDAARDARVEKIIHTSTESVLKGVGAGNSPINEDSAMPQLRDMPGSYCRSKYQAEQLALEAANNGAPVVVVYPTLPIGPGDWKLTPPTQMIQGFLSGAYPAFLRCDLNLVPVEDLARGHILAAHHGKIGERYILCGQNTSLSELLGILERLTGNRMPTQHIPYWLAYSVGAISEFVADHFTGKAPMAPLAGVRLARWPSIFQSTKAENELGYSAGSMEAAIGRAIDWLYTAGLVHSR